MRIIWKWKGSSSSKLNLLKLSHPADWDDDNQLIAMSHYSKNQLNRTVSIWWSTASKFILIWLCAAELSKNSYLVVLDVWNWLQLCLKQSYKQFGNLLQSYNVIVDIDIIWLIFMNHTQLQGISKVRNKVDYLGRSCTAVRQYIKDIQKFISVFETELRK